MPGISDDGRAETAGRINQKLSEALSETGYTTKKADKKTQGLEQEQHDTDPTKLNKNQNANYAKDGGQFGRFNNRDYSTTLRLAREADRYNNKPREHMFHQGSYKGSGIHDMGTGFDRPQLNTMEMRAMDQTRQLDTQQKAAAIALQDAVNHKDLEAYKQAYAQRYGIVLTDAQAKLSLISAMRNAEAMQIMSQGMQYFQRAFGTETGTTLFNMSQSGDHMLASAISSIITQGMVPPQMQEVFAEGAINELAREYKTKHPGANQEECYRNAQAKYNKDLAKFSTKEKAELDWATSRPAQIKEGFKAGYDYFFGDD